jgi:hypothetical protein
VIECQSCHTLNPDSEKACLACRGALLRPARPEAPARAGTGTGTGATRCPAGHPIDPSWKSCPYCDLLRGSKAKEAPGAGGAAANKPLASASPGPLAARLDAAAEPGGPRRTILQENAAPSGVSAPRLSPQPSAPADAGRRMVAVLAAPDLGAGGTVFPVRAGKNVIGADRGSDIVLINDPEVSREHAILLHRQGAFHLSDRLSSNGTWINGRELPASGTVLLSDRDRIRCGKTEFVFLVIESGESASAAS